MEALEGPPKSDALSEYNQGDKSVHDILSVLDKVYGSETSYIALQSELCNMQQAYGETARAFYQRMTPIIVQIQEKHAGRLKEEELANTAKDAFYHGLREEFKPLIAHKLDKPGVKMSDLLQEVRKIEESENRKRSRYPSSVSAKNINNSNNFKNGSDGYRSQQNSGYKHNNYRDKKQDTIGVRMVAPAEEGEEEETDEPSSNSSEDSQSIWKDGYYYCLLQQADEENKRTGSCYNCRETGHRWRDCPQPLRPALQKAKDREGVDEQRLNASGDSGMKGARGPPKMAQNQKPSPAPGQK